ncbi:MAG: M48 family metalloprotease [Actinomycetales bacterium]|nr:M48 family metalloprotease [Actinomycetales bacterium]
MSTDPQRGTGSSSALSPADRESFFAAQRRHRRAARRYSAYATVVVLVQSVPMSVMMAPLLLGVMVLAVDVVNLAFPVPDPRTWVAAVADSAGAPQAVQVALAVVVVIVPGVLVMALIWWVMRRFFLRSGLGGAVLTLPVRAPDPADPEEYQLLNVVAEIAVSAGIATPSTLIAEVPASNAAAVGTSPDQATIVVTRRLLDEQDRDETLAVVGHLVASVANGDLHIGNTVLAVFATYGVAATLFLAPVDAAARRTLRTMLRVVRHRSDPVQEAEAVRELIAFEGGDGMIAGMVFLCWRLTYWVTNLFFVSHWLVAPLRARRYLADATAVQLTRDADSLGRALAGMQSHGPGVPGGGYAAPYFVLDPQGPCGSDAGGGGEGHDSDAGGGGESLDSDAALGSSMHPSLGRRLARLRRLGYLGPAPRRFSAFREHPVRAVLGYLLLLVVGVPLGVAIFATVLALVLTCVLLALLFLSFAVAIVVEPLHVLLRGIA